MQRNHEFVARTARLTAAQRAAESQRPDRLFEDPFADLLAGQPGRELAEQMLSRLPGGDNSYIAVRTRFLDDAVTELLRSAELRQVVMLAAGMDTRAFRLPLPDDTLLLELDQPAMIELKHELLNDAGAVPRCHRVALAADLTSEWDAALTPTEFQPQRKTLWLVEGLIGYLNAAAVDGLLDKITALSAPGSHLLLDVVGQSLLDSPWMRDWLDTFVKNDTAWVFGTDEPEELLTPRGWQAEVTTYSTAARGYGRWQYPEFPRGTPGVPQSYLVHAVRQV